MSKQASLSLENPLWAELGGGPVAELIALTDWSETPLGPSERWPENLRAALFIVLSSPEPRFLWWGESRFIFYNDAALALLGAAHPQALGRPAAEAGFDDATIFPFGETAIRAGEPVPVTVARRGFAEEAHFAFSYHSVSGGIIGAAVEVTDRVLSQRRLRILRRLTGAEARTADQACRAAAQIIEEHPRDFSFALIYLINGGEKQARLVCRVGIAAGDPHAPAAIDLEPPAACPWPLERVLRGAREKIFGLDNAASLPGGFWPEPANAALLAPLAAAGAEGLAGFVIVGASPRLSFDSSYADFLELFAGVLAGALAHARSQEQNRAQHETAALLELLKSRDAERAGEARAVGQLYRLSTQLLRPASLHDALTHILDASMELLGADLGNVQIYDAARDAPEIIAQRGFSAEFLTHFESIGADDGGAWGMALAAREAVLIEDVERDENFAPHRAAAAEAGYRAVFSVPLISRRGDILGVLSTHWREPRRPQERELRMLELYAGHAVDAIERIRAEEAQRESEIDRQKFVSLVENCTDFIGMASPDGQVLYINPGGRDLIGLDSEAAMRQARVVDYLPADMQRYYETEILEKVRSSGQWEGEVAFRHLRTGAPLPVYQLVFQIRYPNDTGALCLATVARDISRRKQSEMMLRASEERFRIATRAGKVGVWEWDIVHNRISWSESLYALHGVTPESFNATLEGFAALIHPEDNPRVSEKIARSLETGEPYEVEFRVLRPDGETIWIFTDGTVVSEDGRPVRMIGATVDITEHKRLEEALRQSERKLRERAQQLEQQLIASGRLISLGEVTASMAHEFNNPLGIIIGFVEDLLGAKKPGDAEFHALKIIDEESRRCKKIVQDLMEYARPKNAEMAPTQVGNVVERCLLLLKTHFYKQQIEPVTRIDPALPRIHADAQQLAQVLVNLFLNAIDAMPNGGRLTVAAELDPDGAPPALVLSVADNGIGIEKDLLAKIFQPFYTAKKRRGLGLGLPICERIIANHGGRIEVKSRHGEGTTFTIYLPLEQRTKT